MEEPGKLQSTGLQTVGHDCFTVSLSHLINGSKIISPIYFLELWINLYKKIE